MTTDPLAPTPIQRRIALATFPAFAQNLARAFAAAGIAPPEFVRTSADHLSATCVACGTRVDGRELGAVIAGEELPAASPLRQLGQGYCVKAGCRSGYYEFTFRPHPSVDWQQIAVETAPEPVTDRPSVSTLAARRVLENLRRQFNWRVGLGLLALFALLLWRQWWSGGRIPFLREGKTYISTEPMDPDVDTDDPTPEPPAPPR